MSLPFPIGTVVRLKSGSPAMTVVYEAANGDVVCQWFDDDDAPQKAGFPALALIVDTDEGISMVVA